MAWEVTLGTALQNRKSQMLFSSGAQREFGRPAPSRERPISLTTSARAAWSRDLKHKLWPHPGDPADTSPPPPEKRERERERGGEGEREREGEGGGGVVKKRPDNKLFFSCRSPRRGWRAAPIYQRGGPLGQFMAGGGGEGEGEGGGSGA